MGRFVASERRSLEELKRLCYLGLPAEQMLRQVCERLRGAVGVDRYCAMEVDAATVLPVSAVHDRGDPEVHAMLLEHALLATPTADPAALHRRGVRAITVDELLPTQASVRTDPYFQFHLFPLALRYEMQVLCVAGGRARAFLTLCRTEASGDYSPRALRLVAALSPHIAAGLHAGSLRRTGLATPDARVGVLVLDEQGRTELANGAGEAWVRRIEPGRWLMAIDVLRTALARGAGSDGVAIIPEVLVRDPRSAALTHLRAEWREGHDGRRRMMVLIEPARVGDSLEPLLLLGLTEREAEVAVGVLRGDLVQEIAGDLGCSPHTVNDHLKRVFDKTGVSSRRELAGVLSGRR